MVPIAARGHFAGQCLQPVLTLCFPQPWLSIRSPCRGQGPGCCFGRSSTGWFQSKL